MLVPLDGSPEAETSIEPALKIARPLDCPLELVTVRDPVYGRWERELDDVADALAYDQVEVTLVGAGWPGDVIVEMASEQPGTLVCMAARHRDQFDRLVLGSVSAHVVRNNPEPVLLVGPNYRTGSAPVTYRELVVCLDGSARSGAALDVAATWARLAHLGVELVHVASPAEPRAARAVTEAELARLADTAFPGDPPTGVTVLVDEDPARAIADLLADRPDALALTVTQGRTGLTRLLLGSFTAELLTRSASPLLIVRAS